MKNKEDYQKLFKEFYSPLCNFVYKMIKDRAAAEDIVQTVFIRIWKNLDKITLKGTVKSYLFQSARNATIDHIRKNKNAPTAIDNYDVAEEGTGVSFDDEAEDYLLKERLLAAIDQLKPKTKEIFKLHKLEGLTYPEIADYLEIPQRTVEYNVYTAIKQLKILLEKTYAEYKS